MKRLAALLGALAVITTACGGGGDADGAGGATADAKTEGLAASATAANRRGFDSPTKLEGKCFSQYVLLATGTDSAGMQRYTLSFHLKANPKDTAELFEFLDKNKCGAQQAAAYERAAKTVGFTPDGRAADPIEISYRTTSGARLFL